MHLPDGVSSFISSIRVIAARSCLSRPRTVVLSALALLLFVASPTASAYTYTLRPVADTTVKQAFPNNNYGSSASLSIRNTATGQAEYSFLRFSIPPLAGNVISATLTLRVTGTVQEVGSYSVAMGNPAWPENWLTWNNWATGTTFTFLGSQTNRPPGGNLSVNVAGWIGGTDVTFALASSADVSGQSFSSKEGIVRPTLTIVTDGSLPECSVQQLQDELNHVLQTGNLIYSCNYKPKLSPDFGDWNGSSENWPLVAAAIALFDGPVIDGTDYRSWWQTFFNRQASMTGTSHVDYFKGSELFSTVYDHISTTSVLVARYWAHRNGQTAMKDLAAAYLRRTWYAWALSTSPEPLDSVWRNVGTSRQSVTIGDPKLCPTLALASSRSRMDYTSDGKRFVLAKILGYNQTCYTGQVIKSMVGYVVGQYPDVSGLTSTQRTALQALINNTTIPSDLASVLGVVRMERDFHWLLWSDGRRVTYYIGHQLNNNVAWDGGKHTVFTAMFNRTTRDLDLLFVEGINNVSCIDPVSRRIYVDNQSVAGCSSTHWITLPPDNPTHHFVLGPTGWRTCSTLNC